MYYIINKLYNLYKPLNIAITIWRSNLIEILSCNDCVKLMCMKVFKEFLVRLMSEYKIILIISEFIQLEIKII